MESKANKFRPCNGRCISFSCFTILLLLIFIICYFKVEYRTVEDRNIFLAVIGFLFLMNLYWHPYVWLKLNSYVYIDEATIRQMQFGKMLEINYNEITDVELSLAYYVRAPYAVNIYVGKQKITFEITSKLFDAFMQTCSNTEVKNKINKLLKAKDIY